MYRIIKTIILVVALMGTILPTCAENAGSNNVAISNVDISIRRGYTNFTVTNLSDEDIDVFIIATNGEKKSLAPVMGGTSKTYYDKTKGDIYAQSNNTSKFVLCRWSDAISRNKEKTKTIEKNQTSKANQEPEPAKQAEPAKPQKSSDEKQESIVKPEPKLQITQNLLMVKFGQWLDNQAYYNTDSIAAWHERINPIIESLSYMKEEMKDDYVIRHGIEQLLDNNTILLQQHIDNRDQAIESFLSGYQQYEIQNADKCRELMESRFDEVLTNYDNTLQELADAARIKRTRVTDTSGGWLMIGILATILAALVFAAYVIRRRNSASNTTGNPSSLALQHSTTGQPNGDGNIVVRRRTASVLKRQNIDDVINNSSYLRISTADFCDDSAVTNIYIKNTCIKDIYNMYAEDLRNPDNPKEDGCMVLGRWQQDGDTGAYDVTLEQVVLPGDDAVFAEYELNFGGKIKLRVHERLRRLRRETDLQYDLTCWVHSHPGLGVFFSNADNNVHLLHKHPTHPFFLTAMVIDILTPDQTLGIFTFKRDGSINAKADLTRMYSLEEMYQWASESVRREFNPNDYFNALKGCTARYRTCRGIELNNSTIIDMSQIAMRPSTGLVGYVHGFTRQQNLLSEYVLTSIDSEMIVSDKELLGVMVIDSHCSLPSVRRIVGHLLGRIRFVLAYATTTDVVTAMPVINGELCTDENYYGENKLEDLKIWTRRKR